MYGDKMDKDQQIENLVNLNNQMIKEIARLEKSIGQYREKYNALISKLQALCEED